MRRRSAACSTPDGVDGPPSAPGRHLAECYPTPPSSARTNSATTVKVSTLGPERGRAGNGCRPVSNSCTVLGGRCRGRACPVPFSNAVHNSRRATTRVAPTARESAGVRRSVCPLQRCRFQERSNHLADLVWRLDVQEVSGLDEFEIPVRDSLRNIGILFRVLTRVEPAL